MLIQSNQMDESVLTLTHCLKSLLDIRRLVDTYKTSILTAKSTLTTPRTPRSISNLNTTVSGNENLILVSYNEVNELHAMKIRNELEKLDYNVKLIERKSPRTQKFDMDFLIKSIGILIRF